MATPLTPRKINGEVECLRFVMALIVVIHHSKFLLGEAVSPLLRGSLAVEFFFLVSGCLMMKSVCKAQKLGQPFDELRDTWAFLYKKVKAVFPEVAVSFCMALLCFISVSGKGIGELIRHCTAGFANDFLLMRATSAFGWGSCYDGVTWYISAMLLAMAVLYPVLRKWGYRPWLLVLSCLLLGWLSHEYGGLRGPDKWVGCCVKGNIRAFCEISLGCLIFPVSSWLSSLSWTRFSRCLFFVLKVALFGAMLVYMHLKPFATDGFFLLMMWCFVTLLFSQIAVDRFRYDHAFFRWLGSLSLPLYLGHFYMNFFLRKHLPENWVPVEKLAVYMVASFLSAAVLMLVCRLLRTHTERMLRLFVSRKPE